MSIYRFGMLLQEKSCEIYFTGSLCHKKINHEKEVQKFNCEFRRDGRTDTTSENNDHLLSLGLVGH